MSAPSQFTCTAFADTRRIASGPLHKVALKAKAEADRDPAQAILIFEDATAQLIEVDLRGSAGDVRERLAAWEPGPNSSARARATSNSDRRGPGRPKLGVVAREVTLLPRHWDWLKAQPGGASVALRKLVDEARRRNVGRDRVRRSQEAAYRFMSAMAGDRPGFEEAARALFAGDAKRFGEMAVPWPADIRAYAATLAAEAFAEARDERRR
jgi:uncharacterized protein